MPIRERISGGSLMVGFETRMVTRRFSPKTAVVDRPDLPDILGLEELPCKRGPPAVPDMPGQLGRQERYLGRH